MQEIELMARDIVNGLAINKLAADIHQDNERWWVDLHTGEPLDRNVGEMIALCHSELSEGLEGYRKSKWDDHLPHRPMLEVELADCVIRCLDLAAGRKLDIGGAIAEKMTYNRHRADHQREARLAEGGKKF